MVVCVWEDLGSFRSSSQDWPSKDVQVSKMDVLYGTVLYIISPSHFKLVSTLPRYCTVEILPDVRVGVRTFLSEGSPIYTHNSFLLIGAI